MSGKLLGEWRHVFKLDPEKELDDGALEALCLSGTDAIVVGGSSGVTYENTVDLLSRIRRYETPCALEVTSVDAVVPGFDVYMVPIVLNTPDADFIVGRHVAALKALGGFMPPDGIVAEGYVILNPECTAARLTSAVMPGEGELEAFARYADRLLRLPVLYLEYSGIFGDMRAVARVKKILTNTRLFYGGGIDSGEKAAAAAAAADTVVVGNVIYESLKTAVDTVKAVQSQQRDKS